ATATFSISYPNSAATSDAVSTSSDWLIVTIVPIPMSLAMTSLTLTLILLASSDTVTASVILMTRLAALGVVISVFLAFFPGARRFFLPALGRWKSRISMISRRPKPIEPGDANKDGEAEESDLEPDSGA